MGAKTSFGARAQSSLAKYLQFSKSGRADVRYVPKADILRRGNLCRHSITRRREQGAFRHASFRIIRENASAMMTLAQR